MQVEIVAAALASMNSTAEKSNTVSTREATASQLFTVERRFHELFKRIYNGSVPIVPVLNSLQDMIEGRLPNDRRFDRYWRLLSNLDVQMSLLMKFNEKYWNKRLSEEDFMGVYDVDDLDRPQWLDDLTVLHVQFESYLETADMWWRVISGESQVWSADSAWIDTLQLLATNVQPYDPGIHIVRLNMVAHWDPDGDLRISDVRNEAPETGEVLAQLEVMSALGLHPELLRKIDGTDLPFMSMPGTRVNTHQGDYMLSVRNNVIANRPMLSSLEPLTAETYKYSVPVVVTD